MTDWSRKKFRQWLRDRVLETRLPSVFVAAVQRSDVERVAQATGIHPELVAEIAEVYQERLRGAGRSPSSFKSRYKKMSVRGPDAVGEAWLAYSDRVHIRPVTAIRSLLHEYLLGTDEPVHKDRRWVVNGALASGPRTVRFQVKMTIAAWDVLCVRAERLGIAPAHLVRCLMVDAMAGRRHVRRPIDSTVMFDDPKRYRA